MQSLDTSVPMILRGRRPASPRSPCFPADLELLRKFDQKGLEITGYPWAGDTYFVYANRGRGGAPPQPDAQGSPLFGHGPDFGYLYYGAIWYGNEIWNGGRLREADANKDGTTDDVELLQWLDENRPGKNDFQPWTKTTHPTLGEVEVGGWNPKFWSQNPPPEMLETWARNEAMFNLYLAQQLAQVKIVVGRRRSPRPTAPYEVTVTVTNEGGTADGARDREAREDVREDTVAIQLSSGQTFAGAPAPTGSRRARPTSDGSRPARLGRCSWTVRGAGTVTVSIAIDPRRRRFADADDSLVYLAIVPELQLDAEVLRLEQRASPSAARPSTATRRAPGRPGSSPGPSSASGP